MSLDPTISVVLITHNRCNYIKDAINSIMQQERKPDEVIVLDDGSTDNTVEYLKELKRQLPMLRWKTQNNLGVGPARMEATNMATGDIIAVLDSDDIFYPNALASYIDIFKKEPDLDLVYGNVARFDLNGNILGETRYKDFRTNKSYKRAVFLRPYVPFKHISMAFRKKTFEEIGGYDEACTIKIDVDLMLKFVINNKKVKHINKTVAAYRIHKKNLSRNRIKGLKQWYRFILKYEDNNLNRLVYIVVRTFWELLKMGAESTRIFKFDNQ